MTEADFAIFATVAEFKEKYGIRVAPHSMRNTISERVVQKIKGDEYGNLHYVEATDDNIVPANLREWNVAESLYLDTTNNRGYFMSSKRSTSTGTRAHTSYFPVVTLSMLQEVQNNSKGKAKDFNNIKFSWTLSKDIIDSVKRFRRT